MYLKSIEIQGFKSFAQKTLLNFNTGVTAIVGPNGSGKSNISDAVRWVLGEQKARQLRGSAMQDVIFAGTEVRKPLGYAHVSITLDNSDRAIPIDYAEVNVSRRLYRSGESIYMLNKQQVRLRDIQELFYGLGVGRDGYSIISQGRVDAVLNGRAEDRRGIFDEAAGIVKYKLRKQAALKKLETGEANLARVTDIVNELGTRLAPLREQSDTAKKYLELRSTQKKLDLNLFIRDTEHLLLELEKSKTDLETAREQYDQAQEEKNSLKEKESVISEKVEALEEGISALNSDLSRAVLLKENLLGQVDVLQAEKKAAGENISRLKEELSSRGHTAGKIKADAEKYFISAGELINGLKLIKKDGGNEGPESAEIDLILKNALECRDKLLLIPGIKGGGNMPEETFGPAGGEEDEDISYSMPDWLKDIKGKRNDLEQIREDEEKNYKWLARATEEYNRLTSRQLELQKEYNEKQQLNARALAAYSSLKDMLSRYEGFGESVKAVMLKRREINGIVGTVAELIKTEKKYELALETALGGRIQNIVTTDEQAAKKCVEFLKKNRKGRATFLPLDSLTMKIQPDYKRALRERGAVAVAESLAECDGEYRGLASFLLANTLVCEDMDSALYIANRFNHSLRIVTLQGELLSPGGAITGGSYRNNTGLIGRQRELDDLKDKASGAQDALEKVSLALSRQEKLIAEKTREIDSLNQAISGIKDDRNKISFSIMSDVKLKYAEFSQRADFVSENIERLIADYNESCRIQAETEKNIQDFTAKINSCLSQTADRQEDIRYTEKEIERITGSINEKTGEKDALTGSRSGYYERREQLDTELMFLSKELVRLENNAEKAQQKMDDASAYIWEEYGITLGKARESFDESLGGSSKIKTLLNSTKTAIKDLGSVNVNAIEEYREVSGRYEFLKNQQQDLVNSQAAITKIIEGLNSDMKKRFNEQFAVIKEQFSAVFKDLFGGGEATLSLVYDEEGEKDELDAGISIEVQPPGKRLKNIIQLSGGEKALTAIALLFAIQKLKPSPFCLLDEIEASLDDINVARFAAYLKRMSRRTQFVVITHRRGTMEAADRLYGITMEEKGISKLISVDLISEGLV